MVKIKRNISRTVFFSICFFACFLAGLLFSYTVFASPVGMAVCNAVSVVMIDIGRALGTLAVVALGVGAMLGKVTWGQAAMVVGGVSLMMFAGAIVMSITTSPTALASTAIVVAYDVAAGGGYSANAAYDLIGCGSYSTLSGLTMSKVTDLFR